MNKIFSEGIIEYKTMVPELELSRKKTDIPVITITNSKILYEYFKNIFPEDKINIYEMMYVIYMNRKNKVIGHSLLSVGDVGGIIFPIKKILQIALLLNSSSLAICHNHPSGDITPSDRDNIITKQLKSICKELELLLLDSMIITENNNYYSFADEGIL